MFPKQGRIANLNDDTHDLISKHDLNPDMHTIVNYSLAMQKQRPIGYERLQLSHVRISMQVYVPRLYQIL